MDTSSELINGCLIDPVEDKFGFVHQCAGFITFALTHDSGTPLVTRPFAFGSGGVFEDPPEVMACCDLFDAGDPPPPQPHEWACYKDTVETFCEESVIPAVVQGLKDLDYDEGVVEDLMNHMNDHLEDCNAAFAEEIDNWDEVAPEGPIGGPANGGETDLMGPEWHIDQSFGMLTLTPIVDPIIVLDFDSIDMEDFITPTVMGDPIVCFDNDFNDGKAFITLEENPEFMLFLAEGDGVLVGPEYDSIPVGGGAEFASVDTSCGAPRCSYISFSENVSDWTLHNLALYSSTSTVIADETAYEVTVDWFDLELVGPVQASARGPNFFQVPAGEAVFLLSTVIEGQAHHLIVTNASSILIDKDSDEWTTSTFALQYTDSESDIWTLGIGGAEWVSPT